MHPVRGGVLLMSASRIALLSLQNRQHCSLTSTARYLADDSTIQVHLPRQSNSLSLPGCGATTRTADQSKDAREKTLAQRESGSRYLWSDQQFHRGLYCAIAALNAS